MNYLGTKIHTTPWDYEVWGVHTREKDSTRNSASVWVISPTGEVSNIITIPKEKMAKTKNWCDFFLGMNGGFDHTQVDALKLKIWDLVNNGKNVVMTQNKATLWEVYYAVCKYIIVNQDDLTINQNAEIFIKDGYGYMLTTYMDDFIKENKLLGYKRIDVLKVLKILGVLKTGKNRPYDIIVKMNGKNRHFYKIEMPSIDELEVGLEEEADEVFKHEH